jgi:hypothetical protein
MLRRRRPTRHHPAMRELALIAVAIVLTACSSSAKDRSDAASAGQNRDSIAPKAAAAAPGDSPCPANGLWAQCAVLYRLERAGLAPHLDSTAKVEEKSLGQGGGATSFVVKIGMSARLEVFLYPDSAARIADAAHLDRREFVGATQEQTIKRERTLIQNANLVGLLTSINSHQRERVSDALSAGAPQPASR